MSFDPVAQSVCGPWIEPEDLCCEGSPAVVDCEDEPIVQTYPWTDEDLILAASNLMYIWTCKRFPGVCEYEARPCVACVANPCYTGRMGAVVLPSRHRVQSVSSVTIDGVVLDPAEYRLVGFNQLVRVGCSDPWPRCQSIDECGEACCSDMVVVYEAGVLPPIGLRIAAADLVCELKKACEGDGKSCALPEQVTSIVRRGVEMEFEQVGSAIDKGRTGIRSVDLALSAYGDCGPAVRHFDPLSMARSV